MLLIKAIELVVKDIRETTDPNLTIREAIEMVRDAGEDAAYGTEDELLGAYNTVLKASDLDITHASGLIPNEVW